MTGIGQGKIHDSGHAAGGFRWSSLEQQSLANSHPGLGVADRLYHLSLIGAVSA